MPTLNSMQTRLIELTELRDGWCDGNAVAMTDISLLEAHAFAVMCANLDEDTPLRIYPTIEGGVSFEIQIDTVRWQLEIEADGVAYMVQTGVGSSAYCYEDIALEDARVGLQTYLETYHGH